MVATLSYGHCALCAERMAKQAVARHLRSCVLKHVPEKGAHVPLFHLRVEDRHAGPYWLDLEVKAASKLLQLDRYLREVWLECCGHLSAFMIGGLNYMVSVDREFGFDRSDRSMNVKLSDVISGPGERFRYEYDFGSTTELVLRVVGVREGNIGRSPVRLLARNEAPVWLCEVCEAPAKRVCPYCLHNGEEFYCVEHAADHVCEEEEEEAFLPVVNSPRMGVCGYCG